MAIKGTELCYRGDRAVNTRDTGRSLEDRRAKLKELPARQDQ